MNNAATADNLNRQRANLFDIRSAADSAALLSGVDEQTNLIWLLIDSIESKEPHLIGHHERVASVCQRIAVEMGLEANRVETLLVAALLHDIGKIKVPGQILSKPRPLNSAEFELVKTHVLSGSELIEKTYGAGSTVSQIVMQHHEAFDGSGYPAGLSGEQILMEARILFAAEDVDGLLVRPPFRKVATMEDMVSEIRSGSGTKYDPCVSATILDLARKGAFDNLTAVGSG